MKAHPEPEANFMLMRGATAPAYNVQTAVDAEHAVIVTHAVVLDAADNRQLQPMVEAAARALYVESFHVTADAGYSNGKQAAECETKGFQLHIATARNVHTISGGLFYSREHFQYQAASDTYTCPAGKTLHRKRTRPKELDIVYRAAISDCSTCSFKPNCTSCSATIFLSPLPRRDAAPHARVCDSCGHETSKINCRTPLRNDEVPNLRASEDALTRPQWCAD
jgi:hypothetical protein